MLDSLNAMAFSTVHSTRQHLPEGRGRGWLALLTGCRIVTGFNEARHSASAGPGTLHGMQRPMLTQWEM